MPAIFKGHIYIQAVTFSLVLNLSSPLCDHNLMNLFNTCLSNRKTATSIDLNSYPVSLALSQSGEHTCRLIQNTSMHDGHDLGL